MYRKILIATDGSALAEKAVIHGLSLAKSVGANVIALIVEPRRAFHSQVRCASPGPSVARRVGALGSTMWLLEPRHGAP